MERVKSKIFATHHEITREIEKSFFSTILPIFQLERITIKEKSKKAGVLKLRVLIWYSSH